MSELEIHLRFYSSLNQESFQKPNYLDRSMDSKVDFKLFYSVLLLVEVFQFHPLFLISL